MLIHCGAAISLPQKLERLRPRGSALEILFSPVQTSSMGAPPVSQPLNMWARDRTGRLPHMLYRQPQRQQGFGSSKNPYGIRRPLNLQRSNPMIIDDQVLRKSGQSMRLSQMRPSDESTYGKSTSPKAAQIFGRYRLRLLRQFTTLASKAFYSGATLSLPGYNHISCHSIDDLYICRD